jgi:hypothetical protein
MRLVLIGPGNTEFHFLELLKIKKEKFQKELQEIASSIADSNTELLFSPDKGICLEIGKLYKQSSGKKIYGAAPLDDKTFGIKHLKPYINEKINGKPLFDEMINTENWYKHDLIKGILGNAVLYLGSSPGTNGELDYAIYLYKIITGQKENIETAKEKIHIEIKADENFTVFVYTKFLLNKKLDKETEAYIKKYNIKLVYIKNPNELKKELVKFD